MKNIKKKINNAKFLETRITKVNQVLNRLESEVEKAVSRFVKKGESSSKVLKKNFDEIVDRISASDLYSRASEKTEELAKEIKKLTDEVVSKVKTFDLQQANGFLQDIRSNLDQVIEKIQNTGIVEIAKDRAVQTRNQVLGMLKIPTQKEVRNLSQKVSNLEKKIKTISRKAA